MKPLYILILGLLFISGCKDDDETGRDVTIKINLTYENEPFAFRSDLTYPDGTIFQISNFSFYASDISVSNDIDSEIMSEVEFFDLGKSHQNLNESQTGYPLIFGDIEIDNINKLDFNIGLTPNQNEQVPSQFNNGHPLAISSEYWPNWNSYIFVKMEGFLDTDDDGQIETGFNLHLGSDNAARAIALDDIIIVDNQIQLNIDIANFFSSSAASYDLLGTPNIHSLEQLDMINFLADNLSQAVKAN